MLWRPANLNVCAAIVVRRRVRQSERADVLIRRRGDRRREF